MPRNRVNADHLAILLEIGAIPRGRKNWMTLRHADAQLADVLVGHKLANKETLAGEPAYQLTDRGREVCAAMYRAAHREIFGEEVEYRG